MNQKTVPSGLPVRCFHDSRKKTLPGLKALPILLESLLDVLVIGPPSVEHIRRRQEWVVRRGIRAIDRRPCIVEPAAQRRCNLSQRLRADPVHDEDPTAPGRVRHWRIAPRLREHFDVPGMSAVLVEAPLLRLPERRLRRLSHYNSFPPVVPDGATLQRGGTRGEDGSRGRALSLHAPHREDRESRAHLWDRGDQKHGRRAHLRGDHRAAN